MKRTLILKKYLSIEEQAWNLHQGRLTRELLYIELWRISLILVIYLIALGSLTNSSIFRSKLISNRGAAWCTLSLQYKTLISCQQLPVWCYKWNDFICPMYVHPWCIPYLTVFIRFIGNILQRDWAKKGSKQRLFPFMARLLLGESISFSELASFKKSIPDKIKCERLDLFKHHDYPYTCWPIWCYVEASFCMLKSRLLS